MSEPMTVRARVEAPVKEVRHALTDAAALRLWLAEHAEVDLPERYAFWGRTTPEGDAPHQRPLHADDTTVRFSWPLGGVDTTVEFGVEEESPSSTIVSVSQTHFDFQEALAESNIRGVIQTYWCLMLANLAEHFAGRPLTPKADFTSSDLRAEVLIAASRERVFDSLIDSESVTRWFGYPIRIEPRVGGDYVMGDPSDDPHVAKVVELEPGRRLSVDWGSVEVTTWELEESEGRTRLTMVQSGFERPPYGAWCGNLSGLAELRRFHEVADWSPIWVS
ncbi:SRPBCC family protein [Nonomuraea rhizosphaerae]|uniref:SRPBCC family protein n=1 Tax=Nonomuraea rhizosphaerae TaxID=2665663 RepID=UPI001FE2C2E6|nr:SRPBCC family protein [Nonomuraea rhizosphaerae]